MATVKLVLQILLVILSLLLTLLILMHKGKGGGLSDMFGGGLTQNAGSSGVAEKNLNRWTVIIALLWVPCIIALGLFTKNNLMFLTYLGLALDRLPGHGPNLSPARLLPQRIQMTSTNNTYDDVTMVVADLDGTLLHDGKTFEDRFLTQRSIDSINRMHDAGIKFVVETARPVSTGYSFVQKLPVDAVAYLNGALLDFNPVSSDYDMLTSPTLPKDGHLQKIGFSSKRACEVCKYLLEELPGMEVGIVMDDVRYTNFDVTKYWKTQTWRYTDFDDVPDGTADKLILFPNEEQWKRVGRLIPDDFDVHISEGSLWMLMNPQANKEHALSILADRMSTPLSRTVSFGDDLVDIAMLRESGRGVAVANANPDVLKIADEICPSNNDDGVAQWVENNLL